jgi:hypothetical protein
MCYSNRDVEDPEYKPAPAIFKDDIEVCFGSHFLNFIIRYSL